MRTPRMMMMGGYASWYAAETSHADKQLDPSAEHLSLVHVITLFWPFGVKSSPSHTAEG